MSQLPKSPPSVRQAPHVGDYGSGQKLALKVQGHRLVCRRSLAFVLILVIALICFGPWLFWLIFFEPQVVQKPLPVRGLILCFAGIMDLALLHMLLQDPRLELDRDARELRLKSGPFAGKMVRRLVPTEVAGLETQTSYYRHSKQSIERGWLPNYVLILVTKSGERVPLCISGSQPQIETLGKAISESFGVPIDFSWADDPHSYYGRNPARRKTP